MAAWFNKSDEKVVSVQRYLSMKAEDISDIMDSLEVLKREDPKIYRKVVESPEYSSLRDQTRGLSDYMDNNIGKQR